MTARARRIGTALTCATVLATLSTTGRAQEAAVVGLSSVVSTREASLTFHRVGDTPLTVRFRAGHVSVGGVEIAAYRPGAGLERAWRQLVTRVAQLPPGAALEAAQQFAATDDVNGAEQTALQTIRQAFQSLAAGAAVVPDLPAADVPATAPAPPAQPQLPAVRPPAAAPEIPVAPVIQLDAEPAAIVQILSGGTRLLAAFVGLAFMGLGILFFAPRQLEAVADTVWHSFRRSFLAGLFAQPLVIPVFGAMIAGLVLTVVGVLVVPFAVVAFVAALILAIAGGYLAIARTVGEIYVRRWKKQTAGGPWLPFKYILYGLGGLLSIWIPAVLLGWIPVAGMIFVVLAALLTWILATAGLGAMIVTRGGVRGTIVRRLDRALTDEHFWQSAEVTGSHAAERFGESER